MTQQGEFRITAYEGAGQASASTPGSESHGVATVPRIGEELPDGSLRVLVPPFVYLPCALDEAGRVTEIKMARLADGRGALMAYSALDRFAHACGDGHPWVVFDTEQLEVLRAEKHFDAAYLDVILPEELRVIGGDR